MKATTMSTAGVLPGAIAEMLLVQAMSALLPEADIETKLVRAQKATSTATR